MSKTKYSRSWVTVCFLLAGVAWMFSSCAKGPKMDISTTQIVFEAYPEEDISIGVSSNIHWDAKLIQDGRWLNFVEEDLTTPNPVQGKGNGTIVLKAENNTSFDERRAFLVFWGDDVQPDTVYVLQSGSIDVAEVIEDEVFRKYCLAEFDKIPKDGKISIQEALNANKITIKSSNVKSLAGIEYFTGLKELDCSNNKIASINLSKNKQLLKINCSYNDINEIDVSGMTGLYELNIARTNIKTINVSKNEKLSTLMTSDNEMTSIDVSNNPNLEILICNNNLLENIDLKNNTKLLSLQCGSNRLKTLDLSNNKSLEQLYCDINQLSTIEVRQMINLSYLSCAQNNISTLNLNNNPKLLSLYCYDNQLGTLDVSRNDTLKDLRCYRNQLTNLDVTKNKYLNILYCSYNTLTRLDVTKNENLQRFECERNSLTTLDLSSNTKLTDLLCSSNPFVTLNLSSNTMLTVLKCTNTNLNGYIDISKNKKLTTIDLQQNSYLAEIWVWQGFNTNQSNYKKDSGAKYIFK